LLFRIYRETLSFSCALQLVDNKVAIMAGNGAYLQLLSQVLLHDELKSLSKSWNEQLDTLFNRCINEVDEK
jgi:hypothetical protein